MHEFQLLDVTVIRILRDGIPDSISVGAAFVYVINSKTAPGRIALALQRDFQVTFPSFNVTYLTLNGIQVARQIRKLAPKSKLPSVSEDSFAEVVEGL